MRAFPCPVHRLPLPGEPPEGLEQRFDRPLHPGDRGRRDRPDRGPGGHERVPARVHRQHRRGELVPSPSHADGGTAGPAGAGPPARIDVADLRTRLASIKGVTAVVPFVERQALAESPFQSPRPCFVRAVPPDLLSLDPSQAPFLAPREGTFSLSQPRSVVVGTELAATLGARVGDLIYLTSFALGATGGRPTAQRDGVSGHRHLPDRVLRLRFRARVHLACRRGCSVRRWPAPGPHVRDQAGQPIRRRPRGARREVPCWAGPVTRWKAGAPTTNPSSTRCSSRSS